MNLLLMGMRGCGKSSVGEQLALRLGLTFIDLDHHTLIQFPQSTIRDVWAVHGEQAWRAAEIRSLASVLSRDKQVISLGGGVPMSSDARVMLEQAKRNNAAWIVYLHCEPDTLRTRLHENPGDRPGITQSDIVQEIEMLLKARDPVYREMADVVFQADNGDPIAQAAQLEVALRQTGHGHM